MDSWRKNFGFWIFDFGFKCCPRIRQQTPNHRFGNPKSKIENPKSSRSLAVRFADLLGLSLAALWQQRVRVILTTLGVLFGSLVLTVSLATNQGAQENILEQYQRFGELRLIDVYPPRLSKK